MTQKHDKIVTITSADLQPLWLKKLVVTFVGNLKNAGVVKPAEVTLKMQLDAELLELIC